MVSYHDPLRFSQRSNDLSRGEFCSSILLVGIDIYHSCGITFLFRFWKYWHRSRNFFDISSAERMHTGILGRTHLFLLRVIFFFVNCACVYFNIFFRFRRVGNYSRKCSNIKFQSQLRKLFFDSWNVTAQNTHTYCQCAYRICAVRFP